MLLLLFLREVSKRPQEWVPEEPGFFKRDNCDCNECSNIVEVDEEENNNIVDIFSFHSTTGPGIEYSSAISYFFQANEGNLYSTLMTAFATTSCFVRHESV